MVDKIRKRDGRVVSFLSQKITNAIGKALKATEEGDMKLARALSSEVEIILAERFVKESSVIPTVEQVQDIVEEVLIKKGLAKTAKAYILYREEHKRIREAKEILGVKDDLKLSLNAIKVLKARYLAKDEAGHVTETTSQFFRRVARHIAIVDILYHELVFDKDRKQSIKPLLEPERLPKRLDDNGLNFANIEMLYRAYNRLNQRGFMRVTFNELLEVVRSHPQELKEIENTFYCSLVDFTFLPNSPTLMNAGLTLGQLSACFVLPVDDSLANIFDTIKATALIHQTGGGTGFSFSRLRPRGDAVKTTKGVASGPLSFMRVFDVATDVVKQGGKRRGANMGILRIDHPDIFEFITAKDSENQRLSNFNISVAITDEFMRTLADDGMIELRNPRNQEIVNRISARSLWERLVYQAWKTGDPGVIFIDRINEHNPTPEISRIEATNPCGEQPLLNYESCNLGSINLAKFVAQHSMDTKKDGIEWGRLKLVVQDAIHFLDNVIDANRYPLPQIEFMTLANRKIGLGVMGFAEMLIKLGVPYDSPDALQVAEEVMRFITETGRKASEDLAEKRGSFPNFKGSLWQKKNYKKMRNATITTIAPTGTISIIAGTSPGIEPLFAVAFVRRNVLGGEEEIIEINPLFEAMLRKEGLDSEELLKRILKNGSIQGIPEIPERIKKLFCTAHDLPPEVHVKMQAAFQKYTDNAVSKTINMPNNATINDVERAYLLAYELGCKGITIYRDQSKTAQVIHSIKSDEEEKRESRKKELADYPGVEFFETIEQCPLCEARLYNASGCFTCFECGYSRCG